MSNESRFRERARMCREEASLRWSDAAARQHWLKLAEEYDGLAETEASIAPPPQIFPMQQQPVQQQQQQKKAEDDNT
jgi:hypothetical protein